MNVSRRPRVAVVGAGIAGIGAAWRLRHHCEVTLFEASDSIGGHAHPVVVEDPTGPVSLETGFVVFNSLTYPCFLQLLDELGVGDRVIKTDMAFSFSDDTKNLYFASTGLRGILFQPKNLFSPRYCRMFLDLLRFRRDGRRDLRRGTVEGTFGTYLQRYSTLFRENLAVPMAATIWSISADAVLDYPARSFLQYFDNHLLLDGIPKKRWLTFKTSSTDYLRPFQAQFPGRLRLRTPVAAIHRAEDGVELEVAGGLERFDGVVLATHADTSLNLLDRPSNAERRLLGAWKYQHNPVVLHTDRRALHPSRSLWRSWNLWIHPDGTTRATYWLNRVQRLRCERDYFVTFGRESIDPTHIIEEITFLHPLFDHASVATQPYLPELNGIRRTWFCGSYFGQGYHEAALQSAWVAADSVNRGITTFATC